MPREINVNDYKPYEEIYPDLNAWELSCKEFLRGCSCTRPNHQEECPECLKAFCDHLRGLAKKEGYADINEHCIDQLFKKAEQQTGGTMKRTKIKYRPKGNEIEIVSIENVATYKEIKDEFGFNVTEEYISTRPRYLSHPRKSNIFVTCFVFTYPERRKAIYAGCVMPKQEFDQIIDSMKAAGERLKRIQENQVKEIII